MNFCAFELLKRALGKRHPRTNEQTLENGSRGMNRKKLLVNETLGEAKNLVFYEETLLSQAKHIQWDNGTDT
ncbi:hypothetical protein TNCV_2226461 [Trichonephila clavipes]|nr:hypothetical protein TNCV_2226461 [Trichonephila clavipes]